MNEIAVETNNLQKKFRRTQALSGLSMRVPRGAVYGFLGRNGAGKTTTIKTLLGLLRPDAGSMRVLGMDPTVHLTSVLERTAFVSEDKILYDFMTAAELLRFTRGFYPRWSDEAAAKYARVLEIPLEKPFRKLSKGNRTKVCLLLALVQNAELLVLDEATSGLDPLVIDDVLRILVEDHAGAGRTILFSTHQLSEVEHVADWVGIIDCGRLLLEARLEDVRNEFRLILAAGEALPATPAENIISISRAERSCRYVVSRDAERFAAHLRQNGAQVVEVAPLDLREVFLELVRKEESCTTGSSGARHAGAFLAT
jgi:ABC-2 type transport system ATP-binding protein